MMHAYDKLYLEKARAALARMLDFAVYDLHQDLTSFFDLFISSGVAPLFEQGDIHILVGKSGVELAYEVLERSGLAYKRVTPQYSMDRSEEYWTGWALAYYQWETAQPFAEIVQYIPIQDILAMYDPYHEMDIRQFCDAMNERLRKAKPETNLKLLRQQNGLSQKQLAEISSVPLRTLQQYEQRQKNINKAQAEYLVSLSTALNCSVEQLIERI
jgi:DNA-binding transcriptional regulator YiaG